MAYIVMAYIVMARLAAAIHRPRRSREVSSRDRLSCGTAGTHHFSFHCRYPRAQPRPPTDYPNTEASKFRGQALCEASPWHTAVLTRWLRQQDHAHVVKYFRAWQADRFFYVQMEFCPLGTLRVKHPSRRMISCSVRQPVLSTKT